MCLCLKNISPLILTKASTWCWAGSQFQTGSNTAPKIYIWVKAVLSPASQQCKRLPFKCWKRVLLKCFERFRDWLLGNGRAGEKLWKIKHFSGLSSAQTQLKLSIKTLCKSMLRTWIKSWGKKLNKPKILDNFLERIK